MTLDAVVRCTCFQEGRAKPPPFSADLLVLREGDDDDHVCPALRVSYTGNETLHKQYAEWLASCCPHEDMTFAHEFIGNNGTWGDLKRAIAWLGPERAPALNADFPTANGGSMSAASCARALGELALLRASYAAEERRIADAETGEHVVGRGEGAFLSRESDEVGIDARGVYIAELLPERVELFRAFRLEQRALASGRYLWVNRETNASCDPPGGPLRGLETDNVPRYLEIVTTTVTAEDFDDVFPRLERIFRASIETGNPVLWC